jgi:hypothetical protein
MTTMKKLFFRINTKAFGVDGKEHIIAIIGTLQWEGQLNFGDIGVQMKNSMSNFITSSYYKLE